MNEKDNDNRYDAINKKYEEYDEFMLEFRRVRDPLYAALEASTTDEEKDRLEKECDVLNPFFNRQIEFLKELTEMVKASRRGDEKC